MLMLLEDCEADLQGIREVLEISREKAKDTMKDDEKVGDLAVRKRGEGSGQ